MKYRVLSCGLLWGLSLTTLHAGNVVTLSDTPEVIGKLTLNPSAVHVEGPPASDINLADILEADFSDTPFHLDYFNSVADTSNPLPAGWKAQDLGPVTAPGSVAYVSGVLTLNSNQWAPPPNNQDQTDHYLFAGQPWTGDGQWTARVKSDDCGDPWACLELRDSLDPTSATFRFGITANLPWGGVFFRSPEHYMGGIILNRENYPFPLWLRLTRRGPSMDGEFSLDGRKWNPVTQNTLRLGSNLWAGLSLNSRPGPAPSGSSWSFSGTSGIQSNGSPYGALPAPTGTQTAFLQGYPAGLSLGSISQSINFPAGTFTASFQAARRGDQIQPIQVSVDGNVVGTYTPASNSFGLITTAPFTVPAGLHKLTFAATDNTDDKSSFLEDVSIHSTSASVTVADGSFQTPKLAAGIIAASFVLNPKVDFDQIRFAPAPGPSPGRIVPTGVLLRSGSFLAGYFNPLNFVNPAPIPAPVGNFTRTAKGVPISIAAALTAAVVYHPVTRKQLADTGWKSGILLPNDDFLAGSFEAINGGGVALDSIMMGPEIYNTDQMRACVLNPMRPEPAPYEIRLKDGSSILATGLTLNIGQLVINEVSGISVPVAPEEIAQVRAGPSRVQALLELPWKATPPPAPLAAPPPASAPAKVPVPNAPAAPATNSPVAAVLPPAAPAADPVSPLECWIGPNQEQILVTPTGTTVDFPLTGKFRALTLRIALSPDSPPKAQASVRILTDGQEAGSPLPLQAGDPPRLVEVPLHDPRTITVVADSVFAGTRVLLIDPVAILEK